MSAELVRLGVLTVCCGGHRPYVCCGENCAPCCPECVTCPEVQQRTPGERATEAAAMRERQMLIRVSASRAEYLAEIAVLDEHIAALAAFTRIAIDVAVADLGGGFPPYRGRRAA